MLCVVEEPHNVAAVENTGEFKGSYHVLMGALSPLQGIGPDDLKIKGLLDRVRDGVVRLGAAKVRDAAGHAALIKALDNRIAMFYAWQHGMGCSKKLPKEQELLQMLSLIHI